MHRFNGRAIAFLLFSAVTAVAAYAHDFSTEPKKFPDIAAPAPEASPEILPAKSVLDLFKVWDAGDVLTVCFMGGAPDVRKFFVDVSKVWDDAASVDFDFGPSPIFRDCASGGKPKIRVSFAMDGNWSYVGTDALSIPPSQATLNIQAPVSLSGTNRRTLGGTILHELGHALALKHEHQSAESNCENELNWDVVNAELRASGWDQAMIDRNMRQFVSSPRLRVSSYDPKSIMHYALPAHWFVKREASSCWVRRNNDVSDTDLAAVAEAYPSTPQQQNRYLVNLDLISAPAIAELKLPDATVKLVEDQINEILARVEERDLKSDLGINVERIITMGACSPVLTANGDIEFTCEAGRN
ncbi:hypothetical protein GOC07_02040 [Sinorhizobium meliloti]|nr:hypothetical protein [Sinorhizobium meliloti]